MFVPGKLAFGKNTGYFERLGVGEGWKGKLEGVVVVDVYYYSFCGFLSWSDGRLLHL